MVDTSICTEKDLAKFKFLSRSHLEKLRFLQDFSQILKDRMTIQESYVKEMTKFANQLELLTSQGALNNILITLKAAYQQKLHSEQTFLNLLKKEIVDSMEEITKKHNSDFSSLMVDKKQLEKEHKLHFEKTEMSQKSYFLHGRERDAVAFEIESLNLRRKQAEQRQQKVNEKFNNMTKIWQHSECEYRVNVGEYNFFLEKFGTGIKKINAQLRNQEAEKINTTKEIARKILNNEPGLSVPSQEIDNLKGILESINPKQELQETLKQIDASECSSLKMEVNPYESFFQKELKELAGSVNEKEEELLKNFRRYYEEILKKEVPAETYPFEISEPKGEEEKKLEQNINFLARLVDIAWRGGSIVTEDLKKFHMMLGDKFLRKIFTAAVQQYRLIGKFVLSDDGFKHTMKILVHFLYACFKIKDAMSIMKIMILSLTFWKVDTQKNKEKLYLHSKIVWHPVWRDLDFWSTSIFLTIREELMHQKSLEQNEIPKETADREKNVVYGQLLSFSHNMVTFMVDKNETKKILEKFCYYYDLENERVKTLLNDVDTMTRQHEQTLLMDKMKKEQEGPKPIKISLISNYFGAKKSPVSSEASDSKSTSDNGQVGGCEASKMMEEFRIEFEDDSLFRDVYGTNRGFSYGGEAGSLEKMAKIEFSYGSEISLNKLDISQESEGRKSVNGW